MTRPMVPLAPHICGTIDWLNGPRPLPAEILLKIEGLGNALNQVVGDSTEDVSPADGELFDAVAMLHCLNAIYFSYGIGTTGKIESMSMLAWHEVFKLVDNDVTVKAANNLVAANPWPLARLWVDVANELTDWWHDTDSEVFRRLAFLMSSAIVFHSAYTFKVSDMFEPFVIFMSEHEEICRREFLIRIAQANN